MGISLRTVHQFQTTMGADVECEQETSMLQHLLAQEWRLSAVLLMYLYSYVFLDKGVTTGENKWQWSLYLQLFYKELKKRLKNMDCTDAEGYSFQTTV